MYRILIVDDENDVICLLKDYFEITGYEPLVAKDGKEALEQIKKRPDVILLDINMPGMDGIALCREIRAYVSCPILFLTARVDDADKIEGFAAGGDDYIVKPFSIDELGARVAAHLRREQRAVREAAVRFWGRLSIDYTAKNVCIEGRELPFPKKEYEIVELLSLHPGQVFDKERIYETVWGYDAEGDSSVVAEQLRRIRQRLREEGEENRIETVWGMGYRWSR